MNDIPDWKIGKLCTIAAINKNAMTLPSASIDKNKVSSTCSVCRLRGMEEWSIPL